MISMKNSKSYSGSSKSGNDSSFGCLVTKLLLCTVEYD